MRTTFLELDRLFFVIASLFFAVAAQTAFSQETSKGVRQPEPLRIETTLVDADALHGATFQSNNQKVVANGRGIFLTHLRTRKFVGNLPGG